MAEIPEGKSGQAAPSPVASGAAASQSPAEQASAKAINTGRRRIVWALHLGVPRRQLPDVPPLFLPPRAVRAQHYLSISAIPADFSLGIDQRYLMTNRVWVVREPDRLFVIFARCTHLGLHAGMEARGKQIQVPLPRQRLRQRRRQLRRPRAASHGSRQRDARSHGKNFRGYQPALRGRSRAPA